MCVGVCLCVWAGGVYVCVLHLCAHFFLSRHYSCVTRTIRHAGTHLFVALNRGFFAPLDTTPNAAAATTFSTSSSDGSENPAQERKADCARWGCNVHDRDCAVCRGEYRSCEPDPASVFGSCVCVCSLLVWCWCGCVLMSMFMCWCVEASRQAGSMLPHHIITPHSVTSSHANGCEVFLTWHSEHCARGRPCCGC